MLLTFETRFLPQLISWFPEMDQATRWGGPKITWPLTVESLARDADIDSPTHHSMMILIDDQLVAFGQMYELAGRAHLARLGVDPNRRGEGFGKRLVQELISYFESEYPEFSLFVYKNNHRAIHIYELAGFRLSPAPVGSANQLQHSVFMVREKSRKF